MVPPMNINVISNCHDNTHENATFAFPEAKP